MAENDMKCDNCEKSPLEQKLGVSLKENKENKEEKKKGSLTPAAEDYLEMIYRLSEESKRPVRICELSECLRVTPSSASRMVQSMAVWGYVEFKRYGYITLTERGAKMGRYLMGRHHTVVEFLRWLTGDTDEGEAERIEHYLSPKTVAFMESKIRKENTGGKKDGQGDESDNILPNEGNKQ